MTWCIDNDMQQSVAEKKKSVNIKNRVAHRTNGNCDF